MQSKTFNDGLFNWVVNEPLITEGNYYSQLLGGTVYPGPKIIFFYGGIFSQWAPGSFHCNLINHRVNCAEQAMMLFKAKTFGDTESFDRIASTNDPSEQKHYGRMVSNFNAKLWDKVKFDAVCSINYDKFTTHLPWRELLLLTHPYQLVEASPTDRIWGIGMSEQNPDILDASRWGQNLLGRAIIDTRNKIIGELK